MTSNNQLAGWWDESRQGSVIAFGKIHNNLYPVLYQYLIKMIRDDDISQDLLQDLFIKMWERKERFGPINNLKVYFFKSARSMAINFIKSQKNHDSLNEDHQCIDMEFSHEEIIVNSENNDKMNRLLASAMNALPIRQREMLYLKYFDEWNYEQIAEVTGIKYQSVANHVHRAITQLRHELVLDNQLRNCRIAV